MSISRLDTAPRISPADKTPAAQKEDFSRVLNRFTGKSTQTKEAKGPADLRPTPPDLAREPQPPQVMRQKTQRLTPPPTRRVMLIPPAGTTARAALDYVQSLPRDVRYVNAERRYVNDDPKNDEILDLNRPIITIDRSEAGGETDAA